MNISNHCQLRYLQRKFGEYIINDSTFPTWKRTHPEDIPLAEKEIQKIISEAERDIIATDNKGVVSKYKINIKENWIIVHDENTAITMYEIKYSIGMTLESDMTIFNLILKAYDSMFEKNKIEILAKDEENIKIKDDIELLDQNIKSLRQQIETLEQHKKVEQEVIKLNHVKINNLKNEVDTIAMKLVKPSMFI